MSLESVAGSAGLARLHAFALVAAMAVGSLQIFSTRGRPPHRLAGWSFAALTIAALVTNLALGGTAVSVGGAPIVEIMLAIGVALLAVGVIAARRNDVLAHSALMTAVFCAVLTASLFSVLPGGALHPMLAGREPTLASR